MTDAWDGRPPGEAAQRDGDHIIDGEVWSWLPRAEMWHRFGLRVNARQMLQMRRAYEGQRITPAEVAARVAAATAAGYIMGREAAAEWHRRQVDALCYSRGDHVLQRQASHSAALRGICALSPPPDLAEALAAREAQAERRGMLRAAAHLDNWPVADERMIADECAAAIRAAAGEEGR